MNETIQIILSVLGLAVILAGQTAAIYAFLIKRIDQGDLVNRDNRNTQINFLHDEITLVKKDYVRRDDFDAAVTRVEKVLDKLHKEVRDHSQAMNARMDVVVNSIASITREHERLNRKK